MLVNKLKDVLFERS